METTLTQPTAASAAPTQTEPKTQAQRKRAQTAPPEGRALTYQLRDGQYDPFASLQASTLQAGLTFEF